MNTEKPKLKFLTDKQLALIASSLNASYTTASAEVDRASQARLTEDQKVRLGENVERRERLRELLAEIVKGSEYQGGLAEIDPRTMVLGDVVYIKARIHVADTFYPIIEVFDGVSGRPVVFARPHYRSLFKLQINKVPPVKTLTPEQTQQRILTRLVRRWGVVRALDIAIRCGRVRAQAYEKAVTRANYWRDDIMRMRERYHHSTRLVNALAAKHPKTACRLMSPNNEVPSAVLPTGGVVVVDSPYSCSKCGERMVFNVPRMGPAGGFVHASNGHLLCATSHYGEGPA